MDQTKCLYAKREAYLHTLVNTVTRRFI